MQAIRKAIFIKPNTFIGGLAATVSTKAALASLLNTSVSNIVLFKIVGANLEVNIKNSYQILASAFQSNTDLTYFKDNEGKLIGISNSSFFSASNCVEFSSTSSFINVSTNGFRGMLNLENFTLNITGSIGQSSFFQNRKLLFFETNATEIRGAAFYDCRAMTYFKANLCINVFGQAFGLMSAVNLFELKKCKTMANDVFSLIKLNCLIQTNIFLATSNGGVANASLTAAKNDRNATVEFFDDNGVYVSTL
jgi:hypothetical protein